MDSKKFHANKVDSFRVRATVETTRFAPLTLDSPPLISIYCLPYENGKLKKIVFYSGHHSSFNWSSYEKCPTLGLYLMNLGF